MEELYERIWKLESDNLELKNTIEHIMLILQYSHLTLEEMEKIEKIVEDII